jgi:hypothetical protein
MRHKLRLLWGGAVLAVGAPTAGPLYAQTAQPVKS